MAVVDGSVLIASVLRGSVLARFKMDPDFFASRFDRDDRRHCHPGESFREAATWLVPDN